MSREDIVQGAADFDVELNEHIDFVIQALQANAVALKMATP